MAIKSLFFEKQRIASFVCQWQHMLPAFQNLQKCSKLPPFWVRKLCWRIQFSQTSLSCRKNLMSCMYDVLCFPVLPVFRSTSHCGTLKCSHTGGIYISGWFWMVGSIRQVGEVESELTAWEYSECKCTVKKMLYRVFWFFSYIGTGPSFSLFTQQVQAWIPLLYLQQHKSVKWKI